LAPSIKFPSNLEGIMTGISLWING
jgi:hypothetical protein